LNNSQKRGLLFEKIPVPKLGITYANYSDKFYEIEIEAGFLSSIIRSVSEEKKI
jgi:hypothetical protein